MIGLFGLLVAGCPAPKSYPGEACEEWEGCLGELDCVAFQCVARCKYEGDCDLGYRCFSGHCIAECEDQSDCNGYGACRDLGEETRGSACTLTNLPQCAQDWHCTTGYCIDGKCERGCDHDYQCGAGFKCVLIDDWRGTCEVDPDYVPPPSNCAEAPNPDLWCQENYAGETCEVATARCLAPVVGFVVVDESYHLTESRTCTELESGDRPGADLQAIRLFDAAGAEIPLMLQQFQVGPTEAPVNYEPSIIGAEPYCDLDDTQPVMWLGCGGGLWVVAIDPADNGWRELPPEGRIQVAESEAICDSSDRDRFSVYLCENRFGGLDCPTLVGTRDAGEAIWEWSY